MAKKSGIPGIGALNTMMDSVEFMKKAWSSFNLPPNLAPTMDVDELDKRIADLRTVEQWLNVNLGMLRNTIQGLEVQRGTLAAVQAFGRAVTGSSDAMAQLAQAARMRPAAPASSPASTAAPFTMPSATSAPSATGPAAPPADDGDDDEPDGDDQAVMGKAADNPASGPPPMQAAVPLQLPSGTQMVNPAAWWNLLQGQFNQVAQAALSGAGSIGSTRKNAGSDPTNESMKQSMKRSTGQSARQSTKQSAKRSTKQSAQRARTEPSPAAGRTIGAPRKSRGPARKPPGT